MTAKRAVYVVERRVDGGAWLPYRPRVNIDDARYELLLVGERDAVGRKLEHRITEYLSNDARVIKP